MSLHLDRIERVLRKYDEFVPSPEITAALDTLPAVREEMAKMREALVVAAVPLEVIAGQIAVKPYSELSGDLQSKIQSAVTDIRTALFGTVEVQHAK